MRAESFRCHRPLLVLLLAKSDRERQDRGTRYAHWQNVIRSRHAYIEEGGQRFPQSRELRKQVIVCVVWEATPYLGDGTGHDCYELFARGR